MKQPHEYENRILVVSMGITPPVLTETLYALINPAAGEKPFYPTEIHVISTETGIEQLDDQLKLNTEYSVLEELREKHTKSMDVNTNFHGMLIRHVIEDREGNALSDIHDKGSNEDCADFITSELRKLTNIDDSALHVSLAGGRKTQGYFTGSAMSLFGRPQDRMSHVLVDKQFEVSGFFFPEQEKGEKVLEIEREGVTKKLDFFDAKVKLAEVPFLLLRGEMPDDFLRPGSDYKYHEIINFHRKSENENDLTIDVKNLKVVTSGVEFDFKANKLELAYLRMFARDKITFPEDVDGGIEYPKKNSQYKQTQKTASDFVDCLTFVLGKPSRLKHGLIGDWKKLKKELTDLDVRSTTLGSLTHNESGELQIRNNFMSSRRTNILEKLSMVLPKKWVSQLTPSPCQESDGQHRLPVPSKLITIIGHDGKEVK